jgi:hypothetical protein
MKKRLVCASALVLLGTSWSWPAHADETGVASIHTWIRVGRKTCMADHFHDGTGTARTRAGAHLAAIRAWSEFTAWEYGSSWGSYGLALSKSAKCARSSSGWSCTVQARPCRPY